MKNLNLLNIKNYFIKIFKNLNIKNICIICMLIINLIIYGLYNINYNKLKTANNNLIAQSDIIREYKNKAGENVYKISSLIMDYDLLKQTNSDLVKEIDKLSKKDKKSLVEITKLSISIDLLKDSINNINNINNLFGDSGLDPVTGLTTFNYELKELTKFRELEGIIKVTSLTQPFSVSTILTVDKVYADLVIGKTLKNDKLELFVSSSNSGLSVTNLEGSIIDVKAYNKLQPIKKFSVGLQAGYGLTLRGVSPYVGVGLSMNLINF